MRSAGLSYREIARAVEVKETSVGTIIARARLALRRPMRGWEERRTMCYSVGNAAGVPRWRVRPENAP
jgi:hypothetical protein